MNKKENVKDKHREEQKQTSTFLKKLIEIGILIITFLYCFPEVKQKVIDGISQLLDKRGE